MARKPGATSKSRQPEITGRLQEMVDSGDTRELARRSMTLQAVMLDLHRQLAGAQSQADLARTMGLALTGSFACERLVVLRRGRGNKHFESVAEIGDVPAALHEEAPSLAARIAPFLPHVGQLAPLLPPFADAAADAAQRLSALGFVRTAWLNVEKQIDWLVLVGPKLSGSEYDTFDTSLLRATLDAAGLASSKLLLVDAQQALVGGRELAIALFERVHEQQLAAGERRRIERRAQQRGIERVVFAARKLRPDEHQPVDLLFDVQPRGAHEAERREALRCIRSRIGEWWQQWRQRTDVRQEWGDACRQCRGFFVQRCRHVADLGHRFEVLAAAAAP